MTSSQPFRRFGTAPADTLVRPHGLPEHLAPIWDEMLPQFSERIGAIGLEAVCVQVYRMREAQRLVTEKGLVIADRSGNPIANPAIAVERAAQGEVMTWRKHFAARR